MGGTLIATMASGTWGETFIARLDLSTGSVVSRIAFYPTGGGSSTISSLTKGTGKVVYAVGTGSVGVTYGGTVVGTAGVETGFLVKVTDATVNWFVFARQTEGMIVDVRLPRAIPLQTNGMEGSVTSVALSSDQSRVYVASHFSVFIVDSATGNKLYNKSSTGLGSSGSLTGAALVGSNLHVVGYTLGATSVTFDSVTVAAPSSKFLRGFGFLFKFTVTGDTLAATNGTWMGTDAYQVIASSVSPAYNVSGYPSALVISTKVYGPRLLLGTGFESKNFSGVPTTWALSYQVRVPNPTVASLKSSC